MATLGELFTKYLEKKVRRTSWSEGEWFMPLFRDKNEDIYGVTEKGFGMTFHANSGEKEFDWVPYEKQTKWLWAYKAQDGWTFHQKLKTTNLPELAQMIALYPIGSTKSNIFYPKTTSSKSSSRSRWRRLISTLPI